MPEAIGQALQQGELADQAQAQQALQEARAKVEEGLGSDALDAEGNLKEAYHNTPVGKRYLEARARAAGARAREALEADIYNHLYTFFSRYWQDGDFISKRRYSAKERYAIPYNGEEVYLYWANHDQYYIKTGEHFTDYAYKAPNGVTIRFKLHNADVEQNNVKGEKRFFLIEVEAMTWEEEQRALTIPVVFRPLTADETERYGQRNQQEAIIQEAVRAIIARAARFEDEALLAALNATRTQEDGREISLLEHHLRRYTRRNTSDFFIHKDLRGFLSRELDFYLKNEVLNLDEIEAAGERRAEGWLQLMRAIKRVGAQIIEFLAQIEDFQKMLWEKKKFVTETFYVITVGNIPEAFYPEIAACEAQWAEWERLFSLSALSNGLFSGDLKTREGRIHFLKVHPTLPLDTRHFDQTCVDRLLAAFGNLDEVTDGLLVHSENWQGLSLLKEKYDKQIRCIYIDPPYNTNASPILYKNDYKRSSWLSMISERVTASSKLLSENGIFVVAIDDEEIHGLRFVLDGEFDERLGFAIVRSNPAGRKTKGKLAPAHEYALFYGKSDRAVPSALNVSEQRLRRFPLVDAQGNYAWANFIRSGRNDRREDRPKLFYPIFVSGGRIRVPNMKWDERKREYALLEQPGEGEEIVYPVVRQGEKVIEKRWQRGHERVRQKLDHYRAKRNPDGSWSIYFKTYMDEDSLPTTWWDDSEYASANYGPMELKALFGEKSFDFSKAVKLVCDCLSVGGVLGKELCLDFFAGSGTTAHAVINL
ncbi:MAG: DNA methyltransferase, partial [Thermoflexales bacterium]|nr:DNA methyltransferase [Thermoflexales bacterium]